jgi:hypothetical protein
VFAKQPRTPKPKAKSSGPRLAKDRERALVAAVANVLRTGQPTLFRFEASCRRGVRIELIGAGWRWATADAQAAAITERALNRIGARRPTWAEGQPQAHATDLVYCAGPDCTSAVSDRRVYCSVACMIRAKNLHHAQERRVELAAAEAARRAAKRAKAPFRPCATCGRPFQSLKQSNRPEQRFCSKSCAATWGNSQRAHPWRGASADAANA